MSSYQSTSDLPSIAGRLRAASHIAVVSHAKPDGDAAGSVLALTRTLRSMGKRVDGIFTGSVDPNILALAAPGEIQFAPATQPDPAIDLVVLVDTGAWSQVEPLDGWLKSMAGKVVGLDHHARGDEIASDRVVDCSMASATQLVVRLVDELGVPLVPAGGSAKFSIAEALFVGLATDTGWFRFQSADTAVFALASRLLAHGVDKMSLYQLLDENGRPVRLAAMARALSSLTFHLGGRATVMALSHADFAQTGATSDDVGGLVNVPLAIGSVAMSAVLTETQLGITKVSFRSKPSPSGAPTVNVSDFAAQFGGGGHAQAAGAKLNLPIADARRTVELAIDSLSGVHS